MRNWYEADIEGYENNEISSERNWYESDIDEHEKKEVSMEEWTDYSEEEAPFEPEDVGCECTKSGISSEWAWDTDHECFVCLGCGAIQ